MCVCTYIVSSRTHVKQVKFTLVQTTVLNTFSLINDYTVCISKQTFRKSFPLNVHALLLISFIYMFQVIYKSVKCRLEFVQSAFIHKEFCTQKNKVKAFISCCFSVMFEKNQCGIN